MVGSWLKKADAAATDVANTAIRLLAWPALYAVCAGAAVYGYLHQEQLPLIATNKLPLEDRVRGLYYAGGAAALVALFYAGSVAFVRFRTKKWSTQSTIAYVNRLLAFLLGTPLAVALLTPGVESNAARMTLVTIVAIAVTTIPTLWVLTPKEGKRWIPERFDKRVELGFRVLIPTLLIGGFVLYASHFSKLSVLNHHAVATRTIDLGYYDNIFYQSAHGRFLDCSFLRGGNHVSAHFDPILVLLSPIYLLAPRAETILRLQSVWLALGIFPAYLLGAHALKNRGAGLVTAATYALHPALHGPNLYEFHSLTLVAPPLLWALYFLEAKRFKSYWATLVILLLVREDVSLLVSFVAIYALLKKEEGYARVGAITFGICVLYFFGVKRFIMFSPEVLNDGEGAYGFSYYFRDMIPQKKGMGGLLTSLVTNPAFVFRYMLSELKLEYLMKMFFPVLGLSVLAKPGRFMLLYGLAFTLLAQRKPVYQTSFQYSMLLMPIIVATAPQGLERLRNSRAVEAYGLSKRRLTTAALGAVVVSSLLISWKFGAIWENKSFRGGFAKITRELNEKQRKRYAAFQEIIAMIEPGAGVTVSNKTGPHVSNRRHVYLYRQKKVHQSHYVFVDERDLRKGVKSWHQRRVARRELQLRHEHGTFKLYRFYPEFEKALPPKKKAKPPPKARPRPNPRAPKNNPRKPPGEIEDDRDRP